MKNIIIDLIKESLYKINKNDDIAIDNIEVSLCKDKKFGDFSSNVAMKYASQNNENPRDFAKKIINAIEDNNNIIKIEIAGPGFINFFISKKTQFSIVDKILEDKNEYGKNNSGENSKILIEFVSANPTGPLHVGHGRGAAFGDCLSNLLSENGCEVVKEYYVNDAGKQIDILTLSVLQRYHELINSDDKFSYEGLYKGDYVWDIAAEIHRNYKLDYFIEDLKKHINNSIDLYIFNIKNILSVNKFLKIKEISVEYILKDIKKTLSISGIDYNSWFLESSLISDNSLENIIDHLDKNNHTYNKEGALWFKSKELGDEKDRVLIKENKDHTYLSTDIAYHNNKIARNFNKVINIWGADHHGYVSRINGAFNIFSNGKSELIILLVQFANLYRGDEKVSMSTRSGDFVTLEQLVKEVGKDATRFFYLARKSDQHMDFDIELAKSNDSNNPVYYIQYAHARICSIFRQLDENKMHFDYNKNYLDLLVEEEEISIIKKLYSYPDIIINSSSKYEPHLLTNYMRELAQEIHSYYNKYQVLIENEKLRNARLALIKSAKYVFENSSKIIGINMPEKM
ncbi:MAG: arginine--tRNA ligase [Gammaproteobacteria bacterium]|nr:arginine--tRNA ligase [Gammaproteobacteria bacterium]MBT7814433.1 arginine--tRNA ligase [Gammaproteobacteria bacterium]